MELYLPQAVAGSAPAGRDSTERLEVLILGIGNVLLGDEGIGVHAVQLLEACGFAARADLMDGGTGGFHLLSVFSNYTRLILIDAAADGLPPGTVSLIHPRYARDFPPSLSAHDIGLKDLLEAASLLGKLPAIDLVTISVGTLQPMSLDLSPAVAAALPIIIKTVELRLGGLTS